MSDLLTGMAVSSVGVVITCAVYTAYMFKTRFEEGRKKGHEEGLQRGLRAQVHRAERQGNGLKVYWNDKEEERE